MRFRHIFALSSALTAVAIGVSSSAAAEDPQAFVEHQHHHIEQLLREPQSPSRDTQVHESLSAFVDYDELTHRAFGEPCPISEPSCDDLWSKYDEGQRAELRRAGSRPRFPGDRPLSAGHIRRTANLTRPW